MANKEYVLWCHTVETLYITIYYSKYFIKLNIDKSTQYDYVALWTHKRPFGRALLGELWSVLYEYFNRNWSCYKGFQLYSRIKQIWIRIHVYHCSRNDQSLDSVKYYLQVRERKTSRSRDLTAMAALSHEKASQIGMEPQSGQMTKNGAQHIAPLCVLCMPHMKWFGEIRKKPRSGQGKNPCDLGSLNLKMMYDTSFPDVCHRTDRAKTRNDLRDHDLLSWKWCATHSPSCVACMPHMKWFSQIGMKPQSRQDQNLKRPMWPWPFTFHPENGAWHITPSCVVYVCHIWSDSVK